MTLSEKALKKYGDPSKSQVHMILYKPEQHLRDSIKCLPSLIYCNKLLAKALDEALNLVVIRGLGDKLKTYDGCFCVRKIRGVKEIWSTHSWGLSVDFNAKENGLGKEPKMSKEIVLCFTAAGFDWGGNFKRKDGMHFQLSEI